MDPKIAEEIERLKGMTAKELREKYREVFHEESRSNNKPHLWKRIAWRLQELQEGGLSERARQRAEELANDADLRIRAPRCEFQGIENSPDANKIVKNLPFSHDRRLPMPGTLLTRDYRGKTIRVLVLEKGFEYEGRVYRSLSAIAKEVTGTHWNGFGFFRLLDKGGQR
jgi:hypothetical protein